MDQIDKATSEAKQTEAQAEQTGANLADKAQDVTQELAGKASGALDEAKQALGGLGEKLGGIFGGNKD